ncbi:hypothetical protein Mycch_2717 [Mycolicibacterium chubuense NBB4]|uniref:DUF7159 domain-containing protein n=1 Tax=Mycolicibacterium chubuense (strain NBB4) TaxID=710421 RepID=I4BJM1_MYCCN|nr:hypothetical protein [Mycolicibacterium chubuense]AFM17478.1 hypothetical protein Mycch_2717 [Mycolicibacterium chubuense NBB4]
MGAVLGLSLTASDIVWALVDASDGALLDHDALEFDTDSRLAAEAARGAEDIARAGGLEVDRVRLVWSEDVEDDGVRLQARLAHSCRAEVEAVPLTCAMAAPVAAQAVDMAPRLALAYGAARADVGLHDAITMPIRLRENAPRRRHRRRIVAAAVGTAAAAVLSIFFLAAAGSPPQVVPAAASLQQTTAPDPGWVSVPAPSDRAAQQVRKVVAATPSKSRPAPKAYHPAAPMLATPHPAAPVLATPQPAAPVLETPQPQAPVLETPKPDAPVLEAPQPEAPVRAETEPAQVPHLPPAGSPHLPELPAEMGPGPLPGPADEFAGPLPGPQTTDPVNLSSPLP